MRRDVVTMLFPGQGSQSPGMGRALSETFPEARQVFDAADNALGFSLSRICFEGPEDKLRQTEITQPAILTTSVAAWKALLSVSPDLQPERVAGHSLGEWTALVVSGALNFEDAVRLVHLRGQLMQKAVPEGKGAMLAVMGLSPEQVAEVCLQVETDTQTIFRPANFNSPEQTVVSGHASALSTVEAALSKAGAKKLVPLPVSAPFHCPLMQPAADQLAEALVNIPIGPMTCPVISNVEATPNQDPSRVKSLLIQQVTGPVRWVEVVQNCIAQGSSLALEIGPGKVLMGLARRIDRTLKVIPVNDPDGINKAKSTLAA